MHRNKSVSSHQFAMVPKAEIPRSSFDTQYAHKTTFDGGYLVPIYCDEVLPGDMHNVKATMFARLATPLFPVMDNLHLDTFSFSFLTVWFGRIGVKFMGEQTNPGDSTSYVVPTITSPAAVMPLVLYLIILVCLLQARLLVLILLRTMLCHCVRIILFIMNGLEMRIYKIL